MRQLFAILVRCATAAILTCGWTAPRAAAQTDVTQDAPSLIVGYGAEIAPDALPDHFRSLGYETLRVWPRFGAAQVRPIAAAQGVVSEAVLAALAESPGIRHAARDAITRVEAIEAAPRRSSVATLPEAAAFAVDDPLAEQQWALDVIGMSDAWAITRGSRNVVVAVIDTGLDFDHPDFSAANIWTNEAEANGQPGIDDDGNGWIDDARGWDWVQRDDSPDDLHGHGTHIAGVIAATTDNGIGVAGIGIGLRVAALRTSDQFGLGTVGNLIDALYYSLEQGFDVVNVSVTTDAHVPALHEAIAVLRANGTLVVSAPGNTAGIVRYPAAYPETVAVAATTQADRRAEFSGSGPPIDLAAPGDTITSTLHTGAYSIKSGTSMATAHVSALAGLLKGLRPDWGPDEIVAALRESAVDINAATHPGNDALIGAGRIDANAAVRVAAGGVLLELADPFQEVQFANAPAAPRLRAVVPDGDMMLPISGAVVRYQMTPLAAEQTQAEPPSAVSGPDGIITTDLGALPQGVYSLLAQIGQNSFDFPLRIVAPPQSVTVQVDAGAAVEAGATRPVHVSLRDSDDSLIAGRIPVSVTTTRGSFANGAPQQTAWAENGSLTLQLHAGGELGIGEITAASGGVSGEGTFTVTSGAPASILGPNGLLIVESSGAVEIPLTFRIADAFENPVADGTAVHFYNTGGTLSQGQTVTEMGVAETTLSMTGPGTSTVSVWTTVPGTLLQSSVEVSVVGSRLWLPRMGIEAPGPTGR